MKVENKNERREMLYAVETATGATVQGAEVEGVDGVILDLATKTFGCVSGVEVRNAVAAFMTPEQARALAKVLVEKADEIEEGAK